LEWFDLFIWFSRFLKDRLRHLWVQKEIACGLCAGHVPALQKTRRVSFRLRHCFAAKGKASTGKAST
jgi:hypothetical protein